MDRPASGGADERRAAPRYPSGLETVCRPASEPRPLDVQARVGDVSLSGIRLLTPRGFEPGELLGIDLPGNSHKIAPSLLGRVVHASRTGDAWAVGCRFLRELTDPELQAFRGAA